MTFNKYWGLVVEKFPHLANEDEKTVVKISDLKSLMRQSYGYGFNFGVNYEKEKNSGGEGDVLNKFSDFFGLNNGKK